MAHGFENITKQHVLDAIKKIEAENIKLKSSAIYDVIVNGKPYPPKEVMRYACEMMNGEPFLERFSGGEETNKYLKKLGFDVINKSEGESESTVANAEIKTSLTEKGIKMHPKNIILYGPPGTGKTFNSIDKAVEIVSAEYKDNDHKSNKKIFDKLRKQGQIEFVTFHQNYTYEDFMIGIKPNVDNANRLTFTKHTGVFYEITRRAKDNWEDSKKSAEDISKKQWLKEKFEEFKEYVQTEIEEKGKFSIKNKVSIYSVEEEAFYFTGEKENGELWNNQRIGIHYDALINMLLEDIKSIKELSNIPALERGAAGYCFELIQKTEQFFSANNYKFQNTNTKKESLKKYVLIIDEINRANISKVFGELITLLEDDKRLGEDNELKLMLPNGENEFGIPPNLYLIGTMNTADKSIALVDIALRRRFEFIGCYPQYEVLDNIAGPFLQQINDAIFEKKKTADYLIGHAYFMKGQAIESVLLNKVIPLLMEYFSGKTDIVESLFNNTDYKVKYDRPTYSWDVGK